MTSPLLIILFGYAGAGKGTQAELLQNKLGLVGVGSGELLRERIAGQGFTGNKLKRELDAGNLAPTAIIFKLWVDRLEELAKNGIGNGILIDGSPKTIKEAELMDEAFEWYELKGSMKVVLLELSQEEAMTRLLGRRTCQTCKKTFPTENGSPVSSCPLCKSEVISRSDDTPEGIRGRFAFFERDVKPVIRYYEDKGIEVIRVNGAQSIEAVHQEILEKLNLR